MELYRVELSKAASKQLDKLPPQVAERIENKLIELEKDPRPHGCIKLTDQGIYRIRVGNYRVIYDIIDDLLIINVIRIAHRKEAY